MPGDGNPGGPGDGKTPHPPEADLFFTVSSQQDQDTVLHAPHFTYCGVQVPQWQAAAVINTKCLGSHSSMPTKETSRMSRIEQALQDVNGSLEEEIRKLQTGESLARDARNISMVKEEKVALDPDDMAAAFFAQQAKKQQEETKLPINEWAKIAVSCRDKTMAMQRKKPYPDITGQTTPRSQSGDDMKSDDSNWAKIDNVLIDKLLLEFRRAMKE